MTLADKIAEARRLDAERASCEQTIERAKWCDNYRDAARARDRLAQIDAHARNHHAALWAVAEAAAAYEAEVTNLVADYTMRKHRREALFAALRALAEVG